MVYHFDVFMDRSYEAEVYLSKISDYLLAPCIKYAIVKYKIEKINKNYFEVKTPDGKTRMFKKSNGDKAVIFE